MWEQVRSNRRKSVVLLGAMAAILVGLGATLGMAIFPPAEGAAGWPPGLVVGVVAAILIWFTLTIVAFTAGDSLLLATARARRIDKADHPRLFNIVEEMTIAAGLPRMPDIYIMDETSPNAFAVGRSPKRASIAVTAGLLAELNRDELQGVVAHEMAHVVNRDVAFMTLMGASLGAIALMCDAFTHAVFYSRHAHAPRGGRSRGGGGGSNPYLFVAALLFAIIGPFAAQILYFAASRRREYLADAHAAILTRYPAGLASALEVIRRNVTPLVAATSVTAPMFIHFPGQRRDLFGIGATHPPMQDRIKILRSIGGGVSYAAYERAYHSVTHKKAPLLPPSARADLNARPVREAHPEAGAETARRARKRHADDLMRKVNGFLLLACVCGTRIKLPPDYGKSETACPRCSRKVAVPAPEAAALLAAAEVGRRYARVSALEDDEPEVKAPAVIRHQPGKWDTHTCACGNVITLSPGFSGLRVRCSACQRVHMVERLPEEPPEP